MGIMVIILLTKSLRLILSAQDQYLKSLLVAFLAAFVGIVVQYQTFSIIYIMQVWFTIGLLIAIQNLIKIKQQNNQNLQ